jgi:hypothetical protein
MRICLQRIGIKVLQGFKLLRKELAHKTWKAISIHNREDIIRKRRSLMFFKITLLVQGSAVEVISAEIFFPKSDLNISIQTI